LRILNIVNEITNRFGSLHKPEKLVILRNDHLGDLILTLPLIQQAEQWLGSDKVAVVVSEPFDELFDHLPLCPEIHPDPGGSFRRLANVLATTRADTLITAASKSRNAYAGQYSGIPQRLGFGYKFNAIFYTHPLFVHRKNPPRHEAEFCLDYLRKFPDVDFIPATLPSYKTDSVSTETVLKDHNLTRPFVVVHPGHSGSAHHPKIEQYRTIVETLQTDWSVLITNKGPEERETARLLSKDLGNASFLQEDISLEAFMAILSEAELFVGGSSGPLHLASLTRTPRVGLYSNDPRYEPAKWKPLGNNQTIITPDPNNTLPEMDSERLGQNVFNEVQELIDK
jgi:ADP-heptose:LPS heptosyltransferase